MGVSSEQDVQRGLVESVNFLSQGFKGESSSSGKEEIQSLALVSFSVLFSSSDVVIVHL